MSNNAVSTHRSLSKRRRVAFRVVALVLSIAISFVAGEVLCRMTVPPAAPVRFKQDVDELNLWGLQQFASVLETDANLFWRLPQNTQLPESAGINFGVISNHQRLREDNLIPLEKPEGELRVLFLGDSCTFGAGVHIEDCYVEIAERQLQQKYPGMKVEFINAGVPGYSLFQGWQYWKLEGHQFQPDLVVACFGFNDMSEWDGMSDLEHHALFQEMQPPRVLRWSRIFQLLWANKSQPSRRGGSRPRLSPEEFETVLSQLHDSAKSHGSDMLLVSWGVIWQLKRGRLPNQEVLHRYSDANGVPLIDLVPLFTTLCEEHGPQEIYLDDVHTTARTNAAIGAKVADSVDEWLQENKNRER